MTTRRQFLGGLAAASGIAFCGCGLRDQVLAQPTAGERRLPVTVNGKRVKTVDVHAHCLIREAEEMMGNHSPLFTLPMPGEAQRSIPVASQQQIEDRLKAMDAMAVDMEVLSINPSWYDKDRDLAAEVIRIQNEKLAELCAAKHDRFAAFASLALQYPDLAVQQLETAVKKQGLRGAAIGTSVGDAEFSDPKFHPVWAKAEELGAVLFIHPQGMPELAKRVKGNGFLMPSVVFPAETSLALAHLIFQGTLDRFPGLKIISSHGGGYLPSYGPRTDHVCLIFPTQCDPDTKLKKKPSEYLKQLYFDSLVFTPEALRHLVAQVGASQVMLGSDYPYAWQDHPVDAIMATDSLSAREKVALLGGNAARVFGMNG